MCVQTVGNGEVELGKEFHNISRLMATPFFSKTHTHTHSVLMQGLGNQIGASGEGPYNGIGSRPQSRYI